jgi:hypothetical protein
MTPHYPSILKKTEGGYSGDKTEKSESAAQQTVSAANQPSQQCAPPRRQGSSGQTQDYRADYRSGKCRKSEQAEKRLEEVAFLMSALLFWSGVE